MGLLKWLQGLISYVLLRWACGPQSSTAQQSVGVTPPTCWPQQHFSSAPTNSNKKEDLIQSRMDGNPILIRKSHYSVFRTLRTKPQRAWSLLGGHRVPLGSALHYTEEGDRNTHSAAHQSSILSVLTFEKKCFHKCDLSRLLHCSSKYWFAVRSHIFAL